MSIFKDFQDDVTENSEGVNQEIEKDAAASDEPVEAVNEELVSMLSQSDIFEKKSEPAAPQAASEDKKISNMDFSKKDTESVTVITKGTTINGSIISDCSLDVMGTINGDIECLGKLTISGTVVGSSMASEIFVNTERLEGNLSSEGSVKIGLGTVVVGDVTGNSAVIAGAVKGQIDINGPVVIDSTAIIKGNVKAKSIQMNNGAVLEGFCSLTSYASLDIDNVFE
ncbi:MAG: polymer-forming cytoskeletal protein [Lachnospiraceae bacterium]|nr:polymer-forming cytoskeletal protein [Lachnospiraceae bacterium]MBP5183622.1 polymer-forming cytoskeletal protein [Lachnospiraceae bacterium]